MKAANFLSNDYVLEIALSLVQFSLLSDQCLLQVESQEFVKLETLVRWTGQCDMRYIILGNDVKWNSQD